MNTQLSNRISTMTQIELYNELYRDPLIGCLNRRAFTLTTANQDQFCFLAIIDLDSLKWINDNRGHEEGNEALRRLAHGLINQFGEDNVFRLGGDEFAVICPHVMDLRARLDFLSRRMPTFTYGMGITLNCADIHLRSNKVYREKMKFRAPRGECPPWALSQVVIA